MSLDVYIQLEHLKEYILLAGDSSDTSSDSIQRDLQLRSQTVLAELENIHNKAIFDGINEYLQEQRPFGRVGPPAPWSKEKRTVGYAHHAITVEESLTVV